MVYSQTSVSGVLNTNTVWTVQGSPYILTASVGIPAGVTLSIDPGVTVKGNFDLLVKGMITLNGEVGKEVTLEQTRVLFKSTALSNSTIKHVRFLNAAGVQLADESEHNQDALKNSGVLTVSNSQFQSNSYARTKGYNTGAKLVLATCRFENSVIKGHYAHSEFIELIDSEASDSEITSDAYNKGIRIQASKLVNCVLIVQCCSARFEILYSELIHCIAKEDMATVVEEVIKIDHSVFLNSFINMRTAPFEITNSRFIANEPGNYQSHEPGSFVLRMGSGQITNTSFEGNGNNTALVAASLNENYVGNGVTIQNSTFRGFKTSVDINNFHTFSVNRCNFLDTEQYSIINRTSKNVDARGNFWGTANSSTIASQIYDASDNIYYGIVDYSNYLTSPVIGVPMSVPQHVFKGMQGERILLSWQANSDLNLAGYKVYAKSVNTNNYTLLADVGNATSYLTNEVNIENDLVVRAYSKDADGIADFVEGNESSYSDYAAEYFSAETVSTSTCASDLLQVAVASNYGFGLDNRFVLQLAEVENPFQTYVNLDTIASGTTTLSALFPNTLEYGKNYLIRVLSTELGVSTRPVNIMYNEPAALSFNAASSAVCFDNTYEISYTGLANGEINWNFNEAEVISGSGSGPYLLSWGTAGKKAINFSINNRGCVSDTTIYVTVAPQPIVPAVCMVTVDEETSKNKLVWSYESRTVKKFGIYRETNVADHYALVKYVDGSTFNTFVDTQSFPAQQANRYKITALDSCGVETGLSLHHKTVHLTINKGLKDSWNLIWTGYEGFAFGTYRIYRGKNSKDMELLTEVASNLTSYTDLAPPTGAVTYQIEVLNDYSCEDNSGGRLNGSTSSKSNIATNAAITGLDEWKNAVVLYPNPTTGKVYLKFESFSFVNGQYLIRDLSGREVRRGSLSSVVDIDLKDQPKGVYFMILNTTDGVISKKIIKE